MSLRQRADTHEESKKIIKLYNQVARTLVEFETMWHLAWCKSVDAAKAGLQATLIIRHPKSNRLYVNFDRSILQLIRESKMLERLAVEVPESAKMVLHQEQKFKSYHARLVYVLREYNRVQAKVPPVIRPMLGPHFHDLDKKIQPGMGLLTWQSMNIDGYLTRIHVSLMKLEELVAKINDVVQNRVEANIRYVRRTRLVDLPDDQSFTLEQFVSLQEKMTKKKMVLLDQKNLEVENAVNDLISVIKNFPFESTELIVREQAIQACKAHYERMMYNAVLQCTKQSLHMLKRRLGSRLNAGFFFIERPFFEVFVELSVPTVTMNPNLDEIQSAVNRAALHVLRCAKRVFVWNQERGGRDLETLYSFHQQIGKDNEIIQSVLRLAGAIDSVKMSVQGFLASFMKYEYLWTIDKNEAYANFMRTKPDFEAFDAELRKYMDVEKAISGIITMSNIGCMSLDTSPLKNSLKAEASAWKTQYAKNLQQQAKEQLDSLMAYIVATCKRLDRKVEDLDDVRELMTVLGEIRDRETEIELEIAPVEERYQLLVKYDVRIPKEEIDAVSDLRAQWRKLKKLASDVKDKLSGMQASFKKDLIHSVKAFVGDVATFRKDYEENGPMVRGIPPMEAVERLKKYQRLYTDRERKWNLYTEGEKLFGLPVTQYPDLAKSKKELELLDKLYSLYVAVVQTIGGYAEIPWADVVNSISSMNDQVNNFQNSCKKLPKALRDWEAFNELKKKIDDFLDILPILEQLSNKAMRPRHWQQIMQITGSTIRVEELKLEGLLNIGILDHRDEIEEICNGSVKELQIETKLAAIAEEWADLNFVFANFKNRGPVILKGQELSEVMEKLEDSQMTLGSMATNRYSAPFREEVALWIAKLSTVADTIEQWTVVQSMWMYMEAVFASGDIAKQLPQEAKRFAQIDKNFLKIVTRAYETRNVINTCYGNEMMKTLLPHLTEQLELCQKSLTGYLEAKRGLFPRFFFVSDPVLLEILSQSSDPNAIRPHLQSVFDSIADLTFDRVKKSVVMEMSSADGEVVRLSQSFEAKGNVEDWLNLLVNEMMRTLKDIVRDSAIDCENMAMTDFVKKYPAQVDLLGIQFLWTRWSQDALVRCKSEKNIMAQTAKKVSGMLSELTVLTTRDLTPLMRTNVETLITIQVCVGNRLADLL